MSNYETLRADADAMGERQDCAVIAIALACDVSYGDAHEALRIYGRESGRGSSLDQMLSALELLGAEVERTLFMKAGGRYDTRRADYGQLATDTFKEMPVRWVSTMPTPGNIARTGLVDPRKRYVAITATHAFAVIGAEVLDWTAGRRHRIQYLWQIGGVD